MQHPLRFGVWALVHGNRAALQDPEEPYDASWERNRKLILEAEQLGYDCTLVALALSILVMFMLHQIQLRQERVVLDTEDYLDQNVVRQMMVR